MQDLIKFSLWLQCYGVHFIDEIHVAEQGWLVGELVQEGQLALAGLAVVDLQHVSQVLRLLGIQDLVVKFTHHQDNTLGLDKLSVEHHTQAFWGIFTVCLKHNVQNI